MNLDHKRPADPRQCLPLAPQLLNQAVLDPALMPAPTVIGHPRASAVSSAASSSVAMDGFSHLTAAASTAAISATAARATPGSSRSLSSRRSRRRTCSQHRRPHSYRPRRRERDRPTRRTRMISLATSALRRLRVLPLAASMAADAPALAAA
jgi:hypothetical protein